MIFHWDMAIYRFSKWRPSAILELFYHHTRPPTKSLLLAAAARKISCQFDTQIWRYSCLNFSHIWLEIPIQAPKMGVLGDFGPLNVIIHHRDPHILASFKLSTVKIRWEVWHVGELTESVTDTQTHKQVNNYILSMHCITLDRQLQSLIYLRFQWIRLYNHTLHLDKTKTDLNCA